MRLVTEALNEHTRFARLRFINGNLPMLYVSDQMPVEVKFENQMRTMQPSTQTAQAPYMPQPQQPAATAVYPQASPQATPFVSPGPAPVPRPSAPQPQVVQPSQPQVPTQSPQPSPSPQLPAPQRRVSFYIEHFGQHTVNYHDVVVADHYIVLVFDNRWTMSGMYVPPAGDAPINIAMQIEGDPNTYLVSATVVDFTYQHLRFAVLQRRATFSEEDLVASQPPPTVNSEVTAPGPQPAYREDEELEGYQPYASDEESDS